MNQELMQRLLGAVVVTALAAIFIPMLFEEPVDNSDKMVSELVIPEQPTINFNDTASKLPRQAGDMSSLPDETSETPEKPGNAMAPVIESDSPEPTGNDTDLSNDPMAGEMPGEEETPPAEDDVAPNTPLDTGEVDEAKRTGEHFAAATPASEDAFSAPKITKKPEAPAARLNVSNNKLPVAAVPSKPVSKPKNPSEASSRWYIQAGSFSKKENALALSETLRKQGMPVLMETIQTSKGTLYRLRVGPELDKKRAAGMKAKLDQQNIKGIMVAE